MRHISFALTTPQFRARTKSVTRRLGWEHAKAGELLQGIVKGQGLNKGEHVERLEVIRVVDARRERLNRMIEEPDYGLVEVVLEGFPEMTPAEFVEMFCRHNGFKPNTFLTRIEYSYVDEI